MFVYCLPQAGAQEHPVLSIAILNGEGAINYAKARTGREVVVQVTDRNDKPVAGASVALILPGDGASATFSNGSKFLTVMTDEKGQAVARGIRSNGVSGKYRIQVRASHNGQTANATVSQTNVAGAAAGGAAAAGISSKLLVVIVAAGAAAAGGAVAATRGSRPGAAAIVTQPQPSPPAAVSIGTPAFGLPR